VRMLRRYRTGQRFAQFFDCCEWASVPRLPCADKRDLGSGHVVYSDRVYISPGIPNAAQPCKLRVNLRHVTIENVIKNGTAFLAKRSV